MVALFFLAFALFGMLMVGIFALVAGKFARQKEAWSSVWQRLAQRHGLRLTHIGRSAAGRLQATIAGNLFDVRGELREDTRGYTHPWVEITGKLATPLDLALVVVPPTQVSVLAFL